MTILAVTTAIIMTNENTNVNEKLFYLGLRPKIRIFIVSYTLHYLSLR
jgi:ABC-type iron transport system FetAB permease component